MTVDRATPSPIQPVPPAIDSGAVFVAAYLASLPSPHSKRNMGRNVALAAHVLSGGSVPPENFQWPALTYVHLVGLVDALAQRYRPATVNNILCAVKGVLKACWLSGAMTHEQYQRAVAAKGIEETPAMRGRMCLLSKLGTS